jgi:hypothetical protein
MAEGRFPDLRRRTRKTLEDAAKAHAVKILPRQTALKINIKFHVAAMGGDVSISRANGPCLSAR